MFNPERLKQGRRTYQVPVATKEIVVKAGEVEPVSAVFKGSPPEGNFAVTWG